MGRIPASFIDDLLSRTDIVEIIDARVPLKKKGHEFQACCPFHHEKTPSFTVSPTKQFYHCFGCGAHGTAITFLMEYDHLPFPEAVEELASRAGLEVPHEAESSPNRPKQDFAPLYDLLQTTTQWHKAQLKNHPQAKRAVDYLKQRGLSGQIAAFYEVGFAPEEWDSLHKMLGQMPNLPENAQDLLAQLGLQIRKERENGEQQNRQSSRQYDRFRNRIIFPIHDSRGRTIGFGGRAIGDEKPKYLNSPESPLFHKGKTLYGLYQARKSTRKLEQILIVEGYMDVLALAQFGIPYSVATLGTATTVNHLNQLFRSVSKVIFCFDGDRAGREAAQKAMETALPLMRDGREIRFSFLPEGEDPDTFVRKTGQEKFESWLEEQAIPFSQFFFDQTAQDADLATIDGRAKLVEKARPKLSKLPPGMFREMMFQQLSELSHLDQDQIADHLLPGIAAATPASRDSTAQQIGQQNRRKGDAPSPIRTLLTMLLQHPQLGKFAPEINDLNLADVPGLPLLLRMVGILRGNPDITTPALLERWRGEEGEDALHKVLERGEAVSEERAKPILHDAFLQLQIEQLDQKIDQATESHILYELLKRKEQLKKLFTHARKRELQRKHE